MLSPRPRARQRWGAGVVFRVLIIGLIGLHGGGCFSTSSGDVSIKPADLTGKSRDWFLEHWGKPRARSKRFFGGENWVYFRLDGSNHSTLFFSRAPHECQLHLTFDPDGIFEEIARSGC